MTRAEQYQDLLSRIWALQQGLRLERATLLQHGTDEALGRRLDLELQIEQLDRATCTIEYAESIR